MLKAINIMNTNYENQKIAFPTVTGSIFLSWKDICYIKSENNYTKLVNVHGEERVVTKSLKWIADRLQHTCFYRVHRSYLVNIYHIVEYHKVNNGMLIMQSGQTIPISRGVKKDILHLMDNCKYVDNHE